MRNQYSKFKTKDGQTKHSPRQVFLVANGFTGRFTDTYFSSRKFERDAPSKSKLRAKRKEGRKQRVMNRRNS